MTRGDNSRWSCYPRGKRRLPELQGALPMPSSRLGVQTVALCSRSTRQECDIESPKPFPRSIRAFAVGLHEVLAQAQTPVTGAPQGADQGLCATMRRANQPEHAGGEAGTRVLLGGRTRGSPKHDGHRRQPTPSFGAAVWRLRAPLHRGAQGVHCRGSF